MLISLLYILSRRLLELAVLRFRSSHAKVLGAIIRPSCSELVLVEQTAEAVASPDPAW